jgi:hypothetical protein
MVDGRLEIRGRFGPTPTLWDSNFLASKPIKAVDTSLTSRSNGRLGEG